MAVRTVGHDVAVLERISFGHHVAVGGVEAYIPVDFGVVGTEEETETGRFEVVVTGRRPVRP
jgi:hypothetical protein